MGRSSACILAGLMGMSLSACLGVSDRGADSGTTVDIVQPGPDAPDPDSIVCDPFGGDGPPTTNNYGGVEGELYYLTPDQPHYGRVSDYIDYGHFVEGLTLYFNQIYIPTRPFDRGFMTQGGNLIQTPEGDTLYEYFALKLKGHLQLGALEAPGLYQMAVLADDGAILRVDPDGDGVYDVLVDDDGTHPTKMACAPLAIELPSATDKMPFQIEYYQGPRYHISLVVLWRPWPADGTFNDPVCGRSGNSLFFDSTQDPPTPQPTFTSLLTRGWKVLEPENYALPESTVPNPCNVPAPTISNVSFSTIGRDTVTVLWNTDVPATSQVIYTKVSTSQTLSTTEDVQMVTAHMATATGLQPDTVYSIKVYSRSASGLFTESAGAFVRTRR